MVHLVEFESLLDCKCNWFNKHSFDTCSECDGIEECAEMRRYAEKHSVKCESIVDAISAIEKQKPKKPDVKGKYMDMYFCPTCHARLRTKNQFGTTLKHKGKYCDVCGQAIDWERG